MSVDGGSNKETIQEIAIKLVEQQQFRTLSDLSDGPKERTIFVLGSKGVVSIYFLPSPSSSLLIQRIFN